MFQNLLVNGAQAMHGRGRIRVQVGQANGWCHIAFIDEGPGIDPNVREKIFVPFFTTKARGTGLGLATVKRFVEAHNGRVTLECPPSGGTTVTLQLPT